MKPIQYNFFRTSKELREQAGEDLQHSWKNAVIVTFLSKIIPDILILIVSVLLFISTMYNRWYEDWKAKTWLEESYTFGQKLFKVDLMWTKNAKAILILILIALLLIYVPLKYGKESYFLLNAKNEDKVGIKTMFSGFKKYFKVLMMELQIQWANIVGVVSGYIALSTYARSGKFDFLTIMFAVISGIFIIIGFYHGNRSKMARMVEIENPDMENDELFELSSKYMDKRIFSQILLHLSFIPFFIIGIFTLFIYDLKVSAQKQSADAFFYLDLK